jgi:hypothetical protein
LKKSIGRPLQHAEILSSVSLPKNIVEKIEKRLPHTEFRTVEDYVEYVLNGVMDKADAMGVKTLYKEKLVRHYGGGEESQEISEDELNQIREEISSFEVYA